MNAEQPVARSWWSRNWAWFVPVGIVLPTVLICGGAIALIVYFAVGFGMELLRSQPPYTDSLAIVQAMPEMQQALGTPIQGSEWVQGNIATNNGAGSADLSYTVLGPNGEASVNVVASRAGGQWTLTTVTVTIDDTGEQLDALQWAEAAGTLPRGAGEVETAVEP